MIRLGIRLASQPIVLPPFVFLELICWAWTLAACVCLNCFLYLGWDWLNAGIPHCFRGLVIPCADLVLPAGASRAVCTAPLCAPLVAVWSVNSPCMFMSAGVSRCDRLDGVMLAADPARAASGLATFNILLGRFSTMGLDSIL